MLSPKRRRVSAVPGLLGLHACAPHTSPPPSGSAALG